MHRAHDLCVAHLEVATSIRGGLGRHLALDPTEFVPAATIDPEVRERVGGTIERHGRGDWR